jgi:hypothetical protein
MFLKEKLFAVRQETAAAKKMLRYEFSILSPFTAAERYFLLA